jgi:hypothetical protein
MTLENHIFSHHGKSSRRSQQERPDRSIKCIMLPNAELDTQLKELRSQSAHDWAATRFFAATNAAAGGRSPADRAARWRLAAKLSVVVALLIWVCAAVHAAGVLPAFALPFLLVAIGIWIGGMYLAGHRFGFASNRGAATTRDELV